MKNQREITIKVIKNNTINYRRIAEYFARKYSESNIKRHKK